jgi:hypothetical protein
VPRSMLTRMDAYEKLTLRGSCAIDGCAHPALMLSEPPRCWTHIENADAWFAGVLSKIAAPDVAEMARISAMFMAHDMYQNKLLDNPLGRDLYADYKNRVDPGNVASFSFGGDIYFALSAAGSGIIGNFAYDVIKSMVKKLGRKNNRPELEETFVQVVRETKYEELRIEYRTDGSGNMKSSSELNTELETRYRLIVLKKVQGD